MVWLLLGALVVYFAVAGWVLHRRWARDPDGFQESDAPGLFGLGEAPAGMHHRMGPSARPRRGR